MNDKVAAAVERLHENFAKAIDAESSIAEVVTADLETILAELGRLSGGGDMLPDALMPVSKEWYTLCERRFAVDKITISGDLARAIVDAISTRPPALGELSDNDLFALFDVMDTAWVCATSTAWICATSPAEGRKDVAKAAREFLGKVDG